MNKKKNYLPVLIPIVEMTQKEIEEEERKEFEKFQVMKLCESCERIRERFIKLGWPLNGSNIMCFNLKCENVYRLGPLPKKSE